jgi:hypothetical protein
MSALSLDKKLHYILRLSIAMCFIGHGAFGIITKPIWVNYFAVFGIGNLWAYKLMPLLGVFDISLGLLILIKPYRVIVLWLVIWGLVTAALRPLSGEPFAELIERAGNFGAPLALLLLADYKPIFKANSYDTKTDEKTLANVLICLRLVAFLLLVGHGWLNLIGKKGLLAEYSALGFANPAYIAHIIGLFEISAGVLVALFPIKPLIIILLVWKVVSELFYPHYEIFEWIERGGSYGTLLALYFVADGLKLKQKENLQYLTT